MLALALIFYRERAIFLDGAFQLVELINDQHFKVYHYRLTNPLTQILPLQGIWFKLPLKVILALYSINFILLFAFIYHLLVGWLKNDRLGWALIFFFTLITLDTFYFLPPELYQGNALNLLLFGIVLKFPDLRWPAWVLPAVAVLAVLIVFSHKLTSFSFLFLWLFFWLHEKQLRNWFYLALLLWVLTLNILHGAFFMDWYDAAKQQEFTGNFQTHFPNFHRLPAHLVFLENCIKHYYFLPVFFAAVLLFYAWKKQVWKLLLVAGFTLGYLLLVHIGSPDAPFRFYAEVNYLPMTLFVTVPLLFDVMPQVGREKWWVWLFAAIIVLRLNVIANNANKFERRLAWYSDQLSQSQALQTNRLLLKKDQAPMKQVIMEWAAPFETLLLSSLESPDSAKTLYIFENLEPYREALEKDRYFLSVFRKIEVEKLNERYFDLGKGRYKMVISD